MVMLDQPYQIEVFKLGQVVHRLDLELRGLRFREPTLKPAKRYYKLKTSKKDKALAVLSDAYDQALHHPTQIWAILAKVRGSRFFFACQCGWQGDEFTVLVSSIDPDTEEAGSWACPKCEMDESGIVITPIEEVVTLA